MDYAVLETHRSHFRESVALAKAAMREGKKNKAKAYLTLALEHCKYVVDNAFDQEEKKRYEAAADKCRALLADETNAFGAEEGEDGNKKEFSSSATVIQPEPISLEEALRRLNELVGLQKIKQEIFELARQLKVFALRKERGLKIPPINYHMVFAGAPGTGKTSVAKLVAQLYASLGIVKKGQLVEATRADLVAPYVGQTALKTRAVIAAARGGVLFIDEAYSLANGSPGDFGQEAIDELLAEMEELRDELVVIVAGYKDLMQQFLNANPGLRSRFKKEIAFDNYTPEELVEIYLRLCKKHEYRLTQNAQEALTKYFEQLYVHHDESFANARTVRNFFEQSITKQSVRIFNLTNPNNDAMTEIKEEDLPINE